MSVLIVEDDIDIRETLAQVLEDEGYQTAGVSNGEEALHYLRSEPAPALILLDLMMPVMDGWQFRAEQLRDPVLAPIPLVILSAVGGLDGRAEAMRAVGFLRKPISIDHLLQVVRRVARPGGNGSDPYSTGTNSSQP